MPLPRVRSASPGLTSALFAQGTVATTVCSPADVLKVRIPAISASPPYTHLPRACTPALPLLSPAPFALQSRIMSASGAEGRSTLQMIRTSMRNEGPMFMFKGWVPAWSRLQPTTILIFLTLEQLRRAVDWTRSLKEEE